MLRIIDRYVFKECALATLAVIAVLLFILLGNSFVRVLGNIAEGKLSADSLLPMLGVNMINYLVILVPLGLYLGILLGMGRFYRDSEMAAMFAGGVGTLQLYRPLHYLAVVVALLSACLVFYLAPWAAARQDELRHRAQYQSPLAGLAPGQFNESGVGQTLFFESLDPAASVMRQVFLYNSKTEQPTAQLARTGVQLHDPDGNSYLVFNEGESYSGRPGRRDFRITEFSSYGLRVREKEVPAIKLRISALPISKLWAHGRPEHLAELHWRFAIPVSCFVLALLALPLSHTSPRKGRFAKLGTGILVYIVYSNLIGLGRAWLERGIVPSWAGLWWIHFIFIAALLLMLIQTEKRQLFSRHRTGRGRAA
ncbi:MAG TPA: LPS export ABC transporter permease LptF [Gammaproteobacteria bacterium]|nr:LPS export ABC transporter permease LptF [Gammaproteobacteria bacterium]